MDFKENIELLLKNLRTLGYDRRKIEKELGYDEKYIDQVLSKGGNKKFLANLERFYIEKSNRETTKDEKIAALMAAIKILTLELIQIKHKQTGESVANISIELETMMQLEAKRQLAGS